MENIKQRELILFKRYLVDLQEFALNGEKDVMFYKRWKSEIEQITEMSKRLDGYLAEKDSETAQQVKFNKHLSFHNNEFTVFKMHIPYYLSGIELYQTEVEAALIEGDLLDKKVNDMTGYEFKTLLLATLKEHQGRKGQ